MLKRMAVACVAGALSTFLWTGEAHADVHGFSWGHGTLNGGPRFASEDLDLGIGLNAGYTLDMGLYLGGLFDYYFAQQGWDLWFMMFDIGFDIGLGKQFVLRPSGSIGMTDVHFRNDGSDSNVAFAMGANAIYAIDQLTLGGEMRFFAGEHDFDGIWIGFNIGVVF